MTLGADFRKLLFRCRVVNLEAFNHDRQSLPVPHTGPPMDSSDKPFLPKTWLGKFGCAFRGTWVGVVHYGLGSFAIHIPVMAAVLGIARWKGVSWSDWYVLMLCITVVLTTEMINSAIEALSQAITEDFHPKIRDALDIASGAVLVASTGAAAIGLWILFG